MSVNNELINCISAFLEGKTVQPELSGNEWLELIRKAEEQKLLPMVFEAAGASMPESLKASVRARTRLLVARQTQRTQEFLRVYKSLSEANIRPLVVKGIVCRTVWAKPEHRNSSDEDMYISLSAYPAFHEKMLELGFNAKQPDYKNDHEERYMRDGLLIEGHWELFPQFNDSLSALNAYTAAFWSRAEVQVIDGVEMTVLEPTDHMIFLLLHAYKHFINSGVGLRQLCDIAQWSKRYELDWQRIYDAMCSAHGECLAAAMFDAGARYFGMTYPPHFERADCTALHRAAQRCSQRRNLRQRRHEPQAQRFNDTRSGRSLGQGQKGQSAAQIAVPKPRGHGNKLSVGQEKRSAASGGVGCQNRTVCREPECG